MAHPNSAPPSRRKSDSVLDVEGTESHITLARSNSSLNSPPLLEILLSHFIYLILSLFSHRSDGINHDIITVYKSFSDATDVRQAINYQQHKNEQMKLQLLHSKSDRLLEVEQHEAETLSEAHNTTGGGSNTNIILPRSDAEHLDIGKTYRSMSVPNLKSDIDHSQTSKCDGTKFDVRNLQFAPGPIRIVHYSKTLNFLEPLRRHDILPPGNILIHSGDFTREGKYEEFVKFDNWLHAVSHIYPYRVVVLGQNETTKYCENWNDMKLLLPHATHILCDTTETIMGLRIHGCPYHKNTQTRKSFLPRMQHNSIYTELRDIDVLVSYEPGYGKLDSTDYGVSHVGNRDLHDAIKVCKPGVHLHGGVAASRAVLFPMGRHPLTLNSCMTDPEGKVLYTSPHVLKATSLEVSEVGVKTWMFEMDSLYDR
jgi:hypothetical protein